jgi:hypothetical protein
MSFDANYFPAIEHNESPSSVEYDRFESNVDGRHVINVDGIRLYNDWVARVQQERQREMEQEINEDNGWVARDWFNFAQRHQEIIDRITNDNDDNNDNDDHDFLSDGVLDDFLLEVFGDDLE